MNTLDDEIQREPLDLWQAALGTANGAAKLGGAITTGIGDYTDSVLLTPKGKAKELGKLISNSVKGGDANSREYQAMTNAVLYGTPLVGLSLIRNPVASVALGSAINAGIAENEDKPYNIYDRLLDAMAYGIGQGAGVFAPAFKENLVKAGVTFDPQILEDVLKKGLKGAGSLGTRQVAKKAAEKEDEPEYIRR